MGANICVLIGLLVLLFFYNSKFEIQLKCINYKKKIKRKRDKIQQKSIISRLIIIKILFLIVIFKTENN